MRGKEDQTYPVTRHGAFSSEQSANLCGRASIKRSTWAHMQNKVDGPCEFHCLSSSSATECCDPQQMVKLSAFDHMLGGGGVNHGPPASSVHNPCNGNTGNQFLLKRQVLIMTGDLTPVMEGGGG